MYSASYRTPNVASIRFHKTLRCWSSSSEVGGGSITAVAFGCKSLAKHFGSGTVGRRFDPRHLLLPVGAIDESSTSMSTLSEESNGSCGGDGAQQESNMSVGDKSGHILSSSDGEDRDTDLLVYSSANIDLPRVNVPLETPHGASKVTAPHFATLRSGPRGRRVQSGVWITLWLIAFVASFTLFFDWYSWQIVRLPLGSFYLTRPFLLSAVLSVCTGFLYIPIVDSLKVHQTLRIEGPSTHSSKQGTPTMGGLFFIPIGISVARGITGHSVQVYGAAVVSLAFSAIGLLDDMLSYIKNHNYGLPAWVKLFLQVVAGTWFSFWWSSASVPTLYNMKMLVPLPQPFGLVYLGKFYLVLTTFVFAAMGNGVNVTDGLDGLAGGVSALAFIGMSVAVLAICPDLAVFGASMSGACIGFLFHNRYKASVFMGDTGSLALGAALAAMAACTGMYLPLFISCGIFILEALSVVLQVGVFKATRRIFGTCRRLFRMAPLHHHFELCGFREPIIVASAYAISGILTLFAGYVGLISV